MKAEKQDLRAYVCKDDGTVIIPKEGTSYFELKQIGFKIVSDNDDIWFLVKIPNDWTIMQNRKDHIQIMDSSKYIRVELHIKFEQEKIRHTYTKVYTRFYVKSRNKGLQTTAYLKDRLDSNFEMPICSCTTVIDDPCFDCEKNAEKRLAYEFPGCTDPARWDNENPLVEIKNAYLKKKA